MKVCTTNDNGSNAFAKNLLAPIMFYLKVDGSLGLDNEKCFECDCNAMAHKVCFNPMNADLQMYNVYLNPFDTGSMEQWLRSTQRLPEMVWWPVWQSSTWCSHYLRVKPCNISTTKLKSLKPRQTCITNCALMWSLSTFSPRTLFRCRNTTCKRSIFTVQWPLASVLCIGIKLMIILCFSLCMVEPHKSSGTTK